MGFISITQVDELFWLGRYSERVYTTIRLFSKRYDIMLEQDSTYGEFCSMLEIPNIYTSAEDFKYRYAFDQENPDSIFSNLMRAYDNAIVLREEIGSETLSYIQLAIYEMNKAASSRAPMIEMQKVIDNILAFWGIADDSIDSEDSRNIIKIGKRVERIDLYARLKMLQAEMKREVDRLTGRIDRCSLHYRKEVLLRLNELVLEPQPDHHAIVHEIEQIVE